MAFRGPSDVLSLEDVMLHDGEEQVDEKGAAKEVADAMDRVRKDARYVSCCSYSRPSSPFPQMSELKSRLLEQQSLIRSSMDRVSTEMAERKKRREEEKQRRGQRQQEMSEANMDSSEEIN